VASNASRVGVEARRANLYDPHPDGSELSFVAADPPHKGEGKKEHSARDDGFQRQFFALSTSALALIP